MAKGTGNRGVGRPKGSRNKLTKDLRDAFEEAVEHAQGTDGYTLKDWATRDKDSNQRFWLAALQTMPKHVDLTSANKALASAVIHVPIPMSVDEWERQNS